MAPQSSHLEIPNTSSTLALSDVSITTTPALLGSSDPSTKPTNSTNETEKSSSSRVTLHFTNIYKSVEPLVQGPSLIKSSPGEEANKVVGPPKNIQILKNVSGQALPGELVAFMGPSGSGKTSLLDCLSNRSIITAGSIKLNGSNISKGDKRRIAYVKQEDIFFLHLTIREQLIYTALLRLPGNWSYASKINKVDKMIAMLKLKKCQNTIIQLVSGGEKKRCSIGTELLTDPSIIMLDEPTSGLDSTSAVALLSALTSLARTQHKTIITSIHQPSSSVFAAFDSLLLLADGGVVFSGKPLDSLRYFEVNLNRVCPSGYNAADFCMDLLVIEAGVDDGSNQADDEDDVESGKSLIKEAGQTSRALLLSIWDDDKEAERIKLNLDLMVKEIGEKKGGQVEMEEEKFEKWNTSYSQQLAVLIHRSMRNSRSAIFTPLNLIKSVVLGLVSGAIWWQQGTSEKYVSDRGGFIFFAMTFWVFDSLFTAMMSFPSERAIIFKERASGSYRLSAYFISKTLSEAPMRLALPLIYIAISYPMANMNNSFWAFLQFAFVQLLAVLSGESIGLAIGATVMDFERALVIGTIASLTMMLSGGFFNSNVSDYVGWVRFLSPFKYSFHACLEIEFDKPVACDGSGALESLCDGNDFGFAQPEDIIDLQGGEGPVWFNVSMLLVIFVVGRFIAYYSLRIVKDGGRGSV